MELRVKDGRYAERRHGGLETVSGAEEAAQRVAMKLSCRRGSFLPLPEFGSRLHLLYGVLPSERNNAAEMYAAEALQGEEDVSILDIEVLEEAEGTLLIALTLQYRGESMLVKTTI